MKRQSVSSDSYPAKNGNKNDRRPDALVKLDDCGAGSTRSITPRVSEFDRSNT